MEENRKEKKSRKSLRIITIFGILLIGTLFILNIQGVSVYDMISNNLEGSVSAQVEEGNPEVTITRSTETTCRLIDGKKVCNLILYSGIRFVEEDNQWKKVEDARSLKGKGFNIVYLENDPSFNIIVNDFNMTFFNMSLEFLGNPLDYLDFCQVTDSLNAKCDFKLDEKWEEFNETTGEVIEKNQIKFQYKWQMKNGVVTKGDKVKFEYKGNPFGRDFSFGGNSTTIKLQEADTENLDDSWVYEANADASFGAGAYLFVRNVPNLARTYIKFNLSKVPSGKQIDLATLYLSIHDFGGGAIVVDSYHVYEDWSEETITWNNQPCGTSFDNSTACNLTKEDSTTVLTTTGDWNNWTATVMVKKSYDDGDENISIALKSEPSGGIYFFSKESGTASLRPYLNITYSTPSPPIVNLDSPANNTITKVLNQIFNASYESVGGGILVNATLNIWNSTPTLVYNETESVTGSSNSSSINFTFSVDDVYEWNYEVCDDAVFCGSNDTNFIITIDTTPPTFDNLANQIADANSSFSFDIDATDVTSSVSCFTVNDTTNFKIDCNGVLQNNTVLSVQVYALNISVNDSANNIAYGTMDVNVTVWDTILKWDWAALMTDGVSPDQICFIYRDGEYCFDETGKVRLVGDATISRVGVNTTTWISSGGNLITKFG